GIRLAARRIAGRVVHAQRRLVDIGGEKHHPLQEGRVRARARRRRQCGWRMRMREVNQHGGRFEYDGAVRQFQGRHSAGGNGRAIGGQRRLIPAHPDALVRGADLLEGHLHRERTGPRPSIEFVLCRHTDLPFIPRHITVPHSRLPGIAVSLAAMIALLALVVWLYLLFAHGRFWSSEPQLWAQMPPSCPDIDIVVPARDEAQTIRPAIESLLAQDYPGKFRIILVDDNSGDGTAQCAGTAANLTILSLRSKPAGWSGKLWALGQGIAAGGAPILLFTDADIVHDPRHLSSLVAKLLQSGTDMVSEMVRL